jgi:hypothetical protein
MGTCVRGLSATLPAILARLDLTSASTLAHTPFATVHSRLSRVVILKRVGPATLSELEKSSSSFAKKEGSVGVWFRRPARNGSPRSANVTAQSCCFFSRVMTGLIINQLTYCPLWFLDASKFARCTKEEVTIREQASSVRVRVVSSGSVARLMNDRLAENVMS